MGSFALLVSVQKRIIKGSFLCPQKIMKICVPSTINLEFWTMRATTIIRIVCINGWSFVHTVKRSIADDPNPIRQDTRASDLPTNKSWSWRHRANLPKTCDSIKHAASLWGLRC